MTDLEHNFSPVIGVSKAARWLGLGERQVTNLCRQGRLPGAYQPSGYSGKWLIPTAALERIRTLPPAPAATSDNADITV